MSDQTKPIGIGVLLGCIFAAPVAESRSYTTSVLSCFLFIFEIFLALGVAKSNSTVSKQIKSFLASN